ncbi:hypothetical protein CR513_47477, partial [Mucuna pruriens]
MVVGERIELGIRHKKFAQASSNAGFAKKLTSKKKKAKANAVLIEPIFPQGKGAAPLYPAQSHVRARSTSAYASSPPISYVPPYYPRADIGAAGTPKPAQQGTRRMPKTLTLIPMTYMELLPQVLEQKLVEIVPLKPVSPPYPRSYDLKAWCDYHGPRPSRWWFARFLRLRAECSKQPSPSPQMHDSQCNKPQNRERAEVPNRRGGSLTAQESDSRMDGALPNPVSQQILDIETILRIDNVTLVPNNAGKSSRQDEEENLEEEVLIELDKETGKTKAPVQDQNLEVVNQGRKERARESQGRKSMSQT